MSQMVMTLHPNSLTTIVSCVDGKFQEKMLIFDVDETLMHATETPLAIALSFRTGPYSVYQRPFVGDFRAIEK